MAMTWIDLVKCYQSIQDYLCMLDSRIISQDTPSDSEDSNFQNPEILRRINVKRNHPILKISNFVFIFRFLKINRNRDKFKAKREEKQNKYGK